MPYETKLISKKLFDDAAAELEALGRYGKLAIRLQSIVSSKNSNISNASKALGFTRASVIKWIKRFAEEGVIGLEDKKGRGRKSIVTAAVKSELKKILESNHNITLKKLKLELKKLNIILSKTTIHRHLKSLGYSHITGRPQHHKQDNAKLEEFKKNSNRNKSKKSK